MQFFTFIYIANRVVFGEIYTTGKNFILPPAMTALTNFTSANRVLRTMLGNLFIKLGYLGPFGQNAPFVTSNPKIWRPNTALKNLFAIFLEHPVYTGEVAG